MKTDPAHLLADALKLPPEDRAALAARLLASLDGDPDEGVEEAWAIEIKQRLEEIDRGEVEMIPWEVARRRILGEESA